MAAAVVTTAVTASAQTLTEAQARAAITPWYVLFNQPVQGDMRALQEQVLTADYESCWGYLPGECWGREASIKVVGGFAKSIPDMKFDIKEVLVSGDRVIVRGEVSGTPAGDLFGVPHTGKSFRIMAIDIQTIRDGKIARTYHLENWLSAAADSFAQSSESRAEALARISVEPYGRASSSSISQTIGGSMKFGTIGAGAVALAFGREALARGHEVVLSSRRGPDALGDKVAELGRGASAASVEEAASLDYVLLAVPWRNVESALKSLPAWNGRVLIDATNPFVETSPKLVLADLGGKGASEVVAALAPGARIVKAFNSIVTARFNEGPVKNGGRRVIFVSGDHPEPTAFIKQLIESFGFTAIDLGGLATGGRLQQAGGPLAGRDLVEFGHH